MTTPQTFAHQSILSDCIVEFSFKTTQDIYFTIVKSTKVFKMLRRAATTVPRAAARALSVTRPSIGQCPSHFVSPTTVAARRHYHEKVLDHYSRPRNVGSMSKTDNDVGTGLVGAPACGDVMKLQIRVDPSNNTISDVKFKTFGCGSAIASSSYLTELVRGMTLEEAGRVRNTEIAKELCLPPVKRKFSHRKQFCSSD